MHHHSPFTCRNAALSVSFNVSMQNCIKPVVCCNFPVQFNCCSCKSVESNLVHTWIHSIVGITRHSTLSILNLLSLSICSVSNRNSRRSCINWINASHCTITNCSNSWHDSCQWDKSKIQMFFFSNRRKLSHIRISYRNDWRRVVLLIWNNKCCLWMHTVTLSLIPLSRCMNSVVERAFSDNCCRLCDNSVCRNDGSKQIGNTLGMRSCE